MRLAAGLMVLCVAAACAARDNRPEPGVQKTYQGLYLSGFEVSSFLPAGVAEQWWLSGDMRRVSGTDLQDVPGLGNAQVMWISVEGTVTEKGPWGHGHLGSGERELSVARVLESKPATLDEFQLANCDLPAPEWATDRDIQISNAYCEELRTKLK